MIKAEAIATKAINISIPSVSFNLITKERILMAIDFFSILFSLSFF